MKQLRRSLTLLICPVFLFVGLSRGQLTLATLKGNISDASRGSVSNAEVSLKSDATGDLRLGTTDNSGAFVISGVNSGNYILKVSAPGFRSIEQHDFILNVGKTTEINLKLEVGTVQTDVQVVDSAGKVAVNTEARLSDTFTKSEMSLLPLSRDIYALPKLSAGATSAD